MSVVFLHEIGRHDIGQAGGKGANLGELITNGFPIPPGFVICADTYGDVFASIHPERSHQEVIDEILNWQFPAALTKAIEKAHQRLQAQRTDTVVYAVRSSATAEDLGDASFAGQHETYYYVTIDNLPLMIRKCWASLWSEEARAYRDTQGIPHADVDMAVVVQEMIPSTISGITFTANPLTGSTDEIVSDATWGMGAAIVDGRVSPDHYIVARDTRHVLSQRISNKKSMVSPTRPSDDNRLIDVPQHQRNVPCLDETMLAEVTDWALKSEAHFGKPQDLEWAIHDGNYYLLQSRPITTLEDDEDEMPTRKLVIFKPVVENFTDPILPLTQQVAAVPYPWYKGRLYTDVLGVHLLLPLEMTDEEAAELVSWEYPENFRIRIRWLMLPVSLSLWFVLYVFTGLLQARTRAMPDDFMDSFRDFVKEVDDDSTLTPMQAMVKLFFGARTFAPAGHFVMFANMTAVVRYFILMGVLNKLLARWIPDVQRDAGSLLCSGSHGVMSTDMGRRIFKLSIAAKRAPEVVQILQTYRPDDIMKVLRGSPAAADFIAEFDEFLSLHGHRGLKEFEMASPRFEEDPAPVLAMVRNYLASETNPDEMEQHTTDNRVALAESIQEKLAALPLEKATGWRWKLVEYLADRARYFIKLRENSRHFHIMAWYSARKKILAAENELLAAGTLKVKGDIFYLEWPEVRALRDGHLAWSDVEDRIRERRMQVIRWSKQTPPKTLNIETTKNPRHQVLAKGQLGGQGASPGTYEGVARVILDPSVDAELHPGEILVAPYTDPAWTPLFLIARAAVVGVGSYLSHAGTIAREYGMPCVVDVTDCTNRIRTGDRLLVDGTEGIVHLLAEEEAA